MDDKAPAPGSFFIPQESGFSSAKLYEAAGVNSPGISAELCDLRNVRTPNRQEQSAWRLLEDLRSQAKELDHEIDNEGILGRVWDFAKCHLGASGKDRKFYDPRALWSCFLDYDSSSSGAQRQLDETRAKIQQLHNGKPNEQWNVLWTELTGTKWDGNSRPLKPTVLEKYRSSQKAGVEGIADLGAGLVATLAAVAKPTRLLEAVRAGAIYGAMTKSNLKAIDGKYFNLPADLLTGAAVGALGPVAEFAGAKVSGLVAGRFSLPLTGQLLGRKIETEGAGLGVRCLSAAAKSGTAGAVFGTFEAPYREIVITSLEGRTVRGRDILARSFEGAIFGFLGGTILGATVDGLVDSLKAFRTGNGGSLHIPGISSDSGKISLSESARLLSKNPDDILAAAKIDPFTLAQHSAEVFEKTGMDLKLSELPPAAKNALTLAHKVHANTPSSALTIPEKVEVARKAAAHIEKPLKGSQPKVWEASFEKVAESSPYKALQAEQERISTGSAATFTTDFQFSFKHDLTAEMAAQMIADPAISERLAYEAASASVTTRYLERSANFFKDLTDPAHKTRLNELVEQIFEKFTTESITKRQLRQMIYSFEPGDRKIAIEILEHCAPNMSVPALKSRLMSLAPGGNTGSSFTVSPDSCGNFLGYLWRKSNRSMLNLTSMESAFGYPKGYSGTMIFDSLQANSLSYTKKVQLEKLHAESGFTFTSLDGFEKGINVIDCALGVNAVHKKLKGLVAEVRQTLKQNNAKSFETPVRQVMDPPPFIDIRQVHPSRLAKIRGIPAAEDLARLCPVDRIYRQITVPFASKGAIAKFLGQYAGPDRELAARMLAQGAEHVSFQSMIANARKVHARISNIARARGIKPENLLCAVDYDPGGSAHLASYIYKVANDLPPERFITASHLRDLVGTGKGKNKALVLLDDTIYSGSQMADALTQHAAAGHFKKVFVGSFGSYEQGMKRLARHNSVKSGRVSLVPAQINQSFISSRHPFFKNLSTTEKDTVNYLSGRSGFGKIGSSLIWPYMYPDNSLEFFAEFASTVLRLPSS